MRPDIIIIIIIIIIIKRDQILLWSLLQTTTYVPCLSSYS